MRTHESGYALIIVLLMAALVSVALSAAVPRILTQGQREKEEELIFRGEQYKRAIGLFYKKLSRYPNSIEELLETNERGFLRRPFPGPMTREGKWRLIRVGPGGELIGSVNQRSRLRPPGESDTEGTPEPASLPEDSRAQFGDLSTDAGNLPIAGVASRSRAAAIKIYKGYSHYHQWEFIYDPIEEAQRSRPVIQGRTTGEDSSRPESPQRRR